MQEDCLTHFITYPLAKNIFKQKYSHEVTDEAGTFLKNLYKETPKHRKSVSQKNPLAVEELLELLKTYKVSALQHERDVFNYVIKHTFRSFSKFVLDDLRNPKYTEIEIQIGAQLFGGIISKFLH